MSGNEVPPGLLSKHLLLVAAATDDRLARSHIGVLAVIIDHCIDKPYSWPGPATIAKKANLDRRAVRRCLTKLEALGFIKIESPGERQNNIYRPHFPGSSTGELTPTGEIAPTGKSAHSYGRNGPGGTGHSVRGVRVKLPSEAVALSSCLNLENKTIAAIFSKGKGEEQNQAVTSDEPPPLFEPLRHMEPSDEAKAAEQQSEREKYAQLIADHGPEHFLVKGYRNHRPYLEALPPAAAAGAPGNPSVAPTAPAAAPTISEVA